MIALVMLPIYTSIGHAPSVVLASNGIPHGDNEVVIEAEQVYQVDVLYQDIKRLKAQYPELSVEQLGKSYFGDPIYALAMGEGDKTLMVTAGLHGWEWIGSYLAMRGTAELMHSKSQGLSAAIMALKQYRIVILPLINPDGVRIAQGEREPLVGSYSAEELKAWKANAWGVDLNRNFTHGYYRMASLLPKNPGPAFYPGRAPGSEKETQAVLAALEMYKPDMLVDLHSSGNIVFWHYNQEQNLQHDRQLAYAVAKAFGYQVSENLQQAVGAHLKDHFIGTYNKPAFIVEVGSFTYRYEIHKEFPSLYQRFSHFLIELAFLIP